MKMLLFSVVLLVASQVFAEDLRAPLKIQTAHITGDNGATTSCRLYRKRVQEFLQRTNEAATAAIREDRLNVAQANRVIDILQRADIPLELNQENILWTFDFDMSAVTGFFDQGGVLVQIDSTYLQWQTDQGVFPDHFRLDMSPDLSSARISYKMSYMEACLAPVNVAVKMTNGLGVSVLMQAVLNRNLL